MGKGNTTVTFITVVYNGVNELEPTIQSILSQTHQQFEYFIIDGGSTDGTVDLIKKYEAQITGWISEKDSGLYDAMNKGMKMGKGDYLWFMNAGDEVHSGDTLQKIVNHVNGQQSLVDFPLPDVIYGETEIINEKGNSVGLRRLKAPPHLTWKSLQWGMVVCHQSFLVKREKCSAYSLQYRFADDIDWMIRVLRSSHYILNSNLILSRFKAGGLSNKNIRKGLSERFRIMVHYYGFFRTCFSHLILGTRLFFYVLRHGRI